MYADKGGRAVIIHTLGPEETDSCDAAHYYLREKKGTGRIMLHACFEDVIDHLEDYQGDYFIIPAAFKSGRNHMDWADFHYAHLKQLTLVTCFCHRLNPLALVRRHTATNPVAYTHPATAVLLENYLENVHDSVEIKYADSKFLAYQRYTAEQAHYVLTNLHNVRLSDNENIERIYTPDMIWCVYQIS